MKTGDERPRTPRAPREEEKRFSHSAVFADRSLADGSLADRRSRAGGTPVPRELASAARIARRTCPTPPACVRACFCERKHDDATPRDAFISPTPNETLGGRADRSRADRRSARA